MTDANSNRAEMTWDGFDRQARWIFPSPTTPNVANASDYEEYGYDTLGNRTSFRKRDGVVLTYAYDGTNKLTQKNVPASTTSAPGYSVFYGYDVNGLQLYARFGSATGPGITNSYDGFGRQASTSTNMDGTARTLPYQYDAHGNRTQIGSASTGYSSYAWDASDRLMNMGATGSPLAQFAYDPAGRRQSLTMLAGSPTTTSGYTYDAIGRLAGLTHDLAGTSADQSFGFIYNPASQIVTRTSANDAYASTSATNTSRGYSTNGLNQYTAVSGNTYVYDLNGNLTFDGTSSYTYDAENRLVSRSTGVSLAYDPNGRLWQVSGPSGTTRFVYDGDQLSQEYDGAGTMLRAYIFGPGADAPLAWFEMLGNGGRRSLHADHQGSIVAVSDTAGNPIAINGYDAWGVPNAGNIGRFGYTGQAWLPELGMYYYKARIYSPMLGRFLQTDPVGYKDQVNLYAYVGNDPVDGTDPSGLVVKATYYANAGLILAYDVDTGESRFASAFSGGIAHGSQGGPIPGGEYAILGGAGDNSYRLERLDSHFGDDRTPEGREQLRLHPHGTMSAGCITCHPDKGGDSIGDLLRHTQTGETTVDYQGRRLGWLFSKDTVTYYGKLTVVNDSNIRFDDKTMRVSINHPAEGKQKGWSEYMCTLRRSGLCER